MLASFYYHKWMVNPPPHIRMAASEVAWPVDTQPLLNNFTQWYSLELREVLSRSPLELVGYAAGLLQRFTSWLPSTLVPGEADRGQAYLLLDPRVLFGPREYDYSKWEVSLHRFTKAIFYVGKGSTQRPYSHPSRGAQFQNQPRVPLTPEEKANSNLCVMKREEAIWNSGHEVLVIRRENLFSVEEAEWEESMIRIFSDEYEVGQQLCNIIHAEAKPAYWKALREKTVKEVVAKYGYLRKPEIDERWAEDDSHYRMLGVARLIEMYKRFLTTQIVRYHVHESI